LAIIPSREDGEGSHGMRSFALYGAQDDTPEFDLSHKRNAITGVSVDLDDSRVNNA